ncbi:MAG: DUF1996 domain-containing protein, partial [Actinomycetota bacterium]
CADNYSGGPHGGNYGNTMQNCNGGLFHDAYGVSNPYSVLEVNIKFPQCWNGQDPTNPANFRHPSEGGWYFSYCTGDYNRTLVNLEYFVNYRLDIDETTEDWYLASDVSPADRTLAHTPGSTNHGDWWSGWHDQTNQMFIDNCVNHSVPGVASGCGFGYLTDGGPDSANPYPGPALKLREQYTGPQKVSAVALHGELCPDGPAIGAAIEAAYCTPAAAGGHTGTPAGSGPATPPATPSANSLFCPVHRGMLADHPASAAGD